MIPDAFVVLAILAEPATQIAGPWAVAVAAVGIFLAALFLIVDLLRLSLGDTMA